MRGCLCGFAVMAVLASLTVWPSVAAGDDQASPVGRKVDAFKLDDHRGKTYSLSDYQSAKVIVLR